MTHRAWFLIFAASLPAHALAQSLHQEANGQRLEIEMPCDADVTISSYAALHGHVILDATAKHQEELNQLAFLEAPRVRLRLKSGERAPETCWRPEGQPDFHSTLQIKLIVPEDFALGVDASGSSIFHIAVGGQLMLELSGSTAVDATTVRTLNLNLSGSSRVLIGQLNGRAHLEMSGSGDIIIRRAETEEVAIEQSGSSTVTVAGGSVAALSIQSSGSGDIDIGATVTNAAVDTSGSGNIKVARVSGNFVKASTGSGQIEVGP